MLSILQTIASGIDAIFGSNLSSAVQGWRDNLSTKADDLANKWGSGTYEEKSAMADKVDGLLSDISTKVLWDTSDAFNTGYSWGEAGGQWISDKVGGIGDMISNLGGGLPKADDPSYSLGDAYDPSGIEDDIANGLDKLGNIDENTKSMELTQEDLEYLRKIAEQEWKKEYTTANITLDVTNNNSVNSELDIGGIATKITDMVYEEMGYLANGVYEV